MRVELRKAAVALAVASLFAAFGVGAASAQNTGRPDTKTGGPLPGPNATPPAAPNNPSASSDVQPVPGAMPNSDAVPSLLSAKNAADDKLPVLAYTFKGLSDDQRRAIYQVVTGKAVSAAPPNAADAAEVTTVLPPSVSLSAIPGDLTKQIPQTSGYQYAMAGDKLMLVAPNNRVVVGVIAP